MSLPEDDSNAEKPQRSFVSGTIFTGGFNSVTRGHVIESLQGPTEPVKSGLVCGMKGCDEKALKGKIKAPCECGFSICRHCFLDCVGNGGGWCPGCKESYREVSEDEEEDVSEEEDQAFPLPSMAEAKLDKRLSVVKSFKAQNHLPDSIMLVGSPWSIHRELMAMEIKNDLS